MICAALSPAARDPANFSPAGSVFGSEAAELHQSVFLRVYRETELPQSALHGYTEALGIYSLVEPDDDVIGVEDFEGNEAQEIALGESVKRGHSDKSKWRNCEDFFK